MYLFRLECMRKYGPLAVIKIGTDLGAYTGCLVWWLAMQLPTGFLGVVKPMTMVTQYGRPFVEYYNALNLIFMELDYRRPNYMTCIADMRNEGSVLLRIGFLDYLLKKSAQVANETPMLISGAKNVSLSPTLSMSFVLLAPSLSNSVLSISKITKHLSCFVTFHSTHCVFRDSFMKMTIGIGKETGGLYYLEGAKPVMSIVFLINRMPACAIDYQTPLQMLSQFHFIRSTLNICPKVFGCGYKCFHPPTSKYYVSIDVQFCEGESYFSRNVSLVPLQREISSKEEERLWLEEKRLWISGREGFN
ncbi:hypothetical protein CK203_106718 [Vitis vinifera]|uniref:Uncharacterized protein n=1 Tax=Vitis vinifera TaxID=29760 RepID=A0A438CWW5_VITVI|nr:hypothetical protein CK203_106718 [Vitis vinifera]